MADDKEPAWKAPLDDLERAIRSYHDELETELQKWLNLVGCGPLTSVAWHPRTRSLWGMAVLKRAASPEGTQVTVGVEQAPFIVHAPLAAERR